MRAVSFVLALAAGIAAGNMSSENAAAQKQRELQSPGAFLSMADRATRSKALFLEAAKVITDPRCMNCHPAGDHPLQGDDHHIHQPAAFRGEANNGVPGLVCATCHSVRNFTLSVGEASYQSIPGHPRWALAPLEMAWEGKSVGDICRQIKDPTRDLLALADQIVPHRSSSFSRAGLRAVHCAYPLIQLEPFRVDVNHVRIHGTIYGEIDIQKDARLFLLPQRPYVPTGTLRRAVAYPGAAEDWLPEEIAAMLDKVGLAHLKDRLEEAAPWDQTLSGGEKQRLTVARVLLHRPDIIWLDQATSALDPKSQDTLMQLLTDEMEGLTIISVGHRPELEQFHSRKLVLERRRGGAQA